MLKRRTFLAGTVFSPFVWNAAARAQAVADVDVAIIGAGAAGLHAAHRARQLGLSARILEARGRVGGRVHTDRSLGLPYDAGAFYIHYHDRNPWAGIARGLNIPTMSDDTLWGGFEVFRNGKPVPAEERARRRGAFGRLSAELDREGRSEDLSFLDAAQRFAPEMADAAGNLTLLSLGEEPGRVSIRDYQQLDSGDDLVVPSGYGGVLEAYATGLDLVLETPVRAVDWSGPGVRLETARGVLTARAVVVTVSVGVLKAEGVRFSPALPAATQQALDGLGMGALSKFAMRFEGTRFGLAPWTQYFDSGSRGDLVNFEFWPFDRNLVVAMFGGDFAREIAAAGEAAALESFRDRLAAILGNDVRKALSGGHLAGWSADPLAQGGYSIARPGHAAARAALAEPLGRRVYFAGEASAGGASMTAGGAALAGARAVEAIRREI